MTVKDDLDFDKRNNFRFEGGQKTPYGRLNYRVITKAGGAYGFYDNGESGEDIQVGITGKSVEVVGTKIKKSNTHTEDALVPAKWVVAKNGDIVFDAKQGNIVLKGHNILIEANGIRKDGDGDVLVKANKGIRVTGPDIRIDGTNVRIMAQKEFTIVGKIYGEVLAGTLVLASGSDFGSSSLMNKITTLAKNFLLGQ
jgi:hypothetical protein